LYIYTADVWNACLLLGAFRLGTCSITLHGDQSHRLVQILWSLYIS
jgi:hypothetical protein